ncbi:MAG TPA: DNRLRE domain-containing protein [Candidatus Eisenbacteria bacterium]|nr:DNRLRE domain-containing protein [Candidatus Eisenbacteria bacterium]
MLQADIIILKPVADTALNQTNPDFNLGGLTNLDSGTTASGEINRAVLKFDIAGSVPPYANIRRVEMSLTVVSRPTQQCIYSLHRLLRDWGEGNGADSNSGSSAKNGEATWQARFFPDILWSAPGATAPADFVEVPSGTQSISEGTTAFTSSTSSPGIIADVQDWLNHPASNFGWILICDDEGTAGTVRSFGSREDPATAASLLVDFDFAPPSVSLFAVADTSLFEYAPDNNLGAVSLVSGTIGSMGNAKRSRALIRFTTQDIPTNAVLTSATLKLTQYRAPGGGSAPGVFSLYRILKPWGEGNKEGSRGSPAEPSEATWNARFFPSALWSAPGGASPEDFSLLASSTQTTTAFTFTNLLADVEFWLAHPEQNFGWILISENEETPYTARRFYSREAGDPRYAPTLVLEYVFPPEIEQTEIVGNQCNLYFVAQAGQAYFAQSRDSLSSGNWMTFTNIIAQSITSKVLISDPVTGSLRFYRIGL